MPRGQTSRLAAAWVADETATPWRTLDGTAVLADLAGFTRLTEVLTGTGAEGVERLHSVLTLTFGALLGRSLQLGGDVLGFAGDAALVWFDGDDHARRGAEAAAAMPAGLAGLPASSTSGARLRVSVGAHTGSFTAVLAGTTQRGLFMGGPAASTVVALQAAARPGQVLMSAALADAVPVAWRGPMVSGGVELRRRGRAGGRTLDGAYSADLDDVTRGSGIAERRLLSPAVWDVMQAGAATSDHRVASIGFVQVSGIEAVLAAGGPEAMHHMFHEVATTVAEVSARLGVNWLDADIGVDSAKLVLTAGAPQAIEDDEDRLLLALRRILDECSVPLRAGAQRGKVFAAPLGVAQRLTYTVLGDPVNVAARALGVAGDRELVVGDGLDVEGRDHVDATPLGSMSLKNRVRPMPMWRVTQVRSRAAAPRAAVPFAAEVGRHGQWLQLAAAWKATVDDSGCEVLLVSEPGMGASNLLAAVTDLAGAAATSVVAHPFLEFVPYAAVADVANGLARAVGVESDAPLAWLLSCADRLPPLLRDWVPAAQATLVDHDPRTDADPLNTAMRTRVVTAALLRLVAPRPWLLAIDDIDRIDSASRAVLGELCAAVAGEQVMIVSSAGPGAGAIPHQANALVIELGPLDDAASAELVLEIAPSLRDDQVSRIVAAGKGNPFVLAELSRRPSDDELPDSLQRLSASLIDALPPELRSVVRDASAFGANVPLATLAAVLDRPELDDVEWWKSTFPVLRAGAPGTVVFRHDALRVAAHGSMPFRRRRMLHGAIADHWARTGGATDAVLALHYERAGRASEAYPLARAAALTAKASGAMMEACDLLGQALRLAADVAPQTIGALQLERGEALVLLGDLDGAESALAASARKLEDPVLYARMCHQRASVALTRSMFGAARTWIRKGLGAVAPLGDEAAEQRGRLQLDQAAVLDLNGRHSESLTPAAQALSLAVRTGNRTLEGLAHLHFGMAHVAMMNPEALDHVEAAVAIFETIGHDRYLNSSLNNSGLVAMYLGRWDDAIDRYRRAAEHGDRCGNAPDRAIVEMNIGFLLFRQGHLHEAAMHARRSLRTFDTIGVTQQSAIARYLLSEIAAAEGDFGKAAATMASARSTFAAHGDAAMLIDCDVAAMEQLLKAGRADAARAVVPQLTAQLAAAEVPVLITYERTLGSVEALEGDPAGIGRIGRALDLARHHQLVYDEYLCLGALISAVDCRPADDGTLPSTVKELDQLHSERDSIARRLGMVARWIDAP